VSLLAGLASAWPATSPPWALGIWSGVTASALGLGPLLGALVNDSLSWAWIFLLNVPLGAAVWLVARALLRESRAAHPAKHLDARGVLSSGIALTDRQAGSRRAGDGGVILITSVAATVASRTARSGVGLPPRGHVHSRTSGLPQSASACRRARGRGDVPAGGQFATPDGPTRGSPRPWLSINATRG